MTTAHLVALPRAGGRGGCPRTQTPQPEPETTRPDCPVAEWVAGDATLTCVAAK